MLVSSCKERAQVTELSAAPILRDVGLDWPPTLFFILKIGFIAILISAYPLKWESFTFENDPTLKKFNELPIQHTTSPYS